MSAFDPIPTLSGVVKQADRKYSQVVLPYCSPSDAGAIMRRLSFLGSAGE